MIVSQSDKFYILLNGVVEMYAIKPSDEEEVEKDNINNSNNIQQNDQSQNNNPHQNNNTTKQTEEIQEQVLYLQKILKSGCSFGEIGLICNKSRTATISCAEDSHFAVLDKQDFVAILKPIEEKKMMQQTEFLGSLPCFNGWPFHFLRDIYLNISKRQLNRGDYIFREGDKSTFIAIVTRGKLVVYKEFLVQKPLLVEENSQINAIQNEKNQKKKKQETIKNNQPFNINESSRKMIKETKKVNLFNNQIIFFERFYLLNNDNIYYLIWNQKTHVLNSYFNQLNIILLMNQIIELGDKDLFGEDDVVKNRKRQYSVKCESSDGGEIIIITKQVFRERILCREIANRTIHSMIPLKEQIFEERVQLIEQNLQNYKNLLRENRAELQNDIIKEKKLQQEQEEYYKKYFSNQVQDFQQRDINFQVISCNNKSDIYVRNQDFERSNRNKNYEIGSFTAMHASLLNIGNNSPNETRYWNAYTPSKNNAVLAIGSVSPSKSPKQDSRYSPRQEFNLKDKNSTHQQFFVEQLYMPPLNELSNENIHVERKYWPENLQNNNIQDELDIICLQDSSYTQQSNRKNIMMDEKGNGIPLIDPMRNEEDLDRQSKRKNYLGEWRKGVHELDKVYGILRNAGYFDEKLSEIKGSQYKKYGSQFEVSTPQADSLLNTAKGTFYSNQVYTPSKTSFEFNRKKFGQERVSPDNKYKVNISKDNKLQSQLSRKQSKDESYDMMDYYLNQSNLYSAQLREECGYDSSQDSQYVYNNQLFTKKSNNLQTSELQNSPLTCLKNQKFNSQNSSRGQSNINGGGIPINNIGTENNLCKNYPLQNSVNPGLTSHVNTLHSFYQQKQLQQSNLQPLSHRQQMSFKRKTIGNSGLRDGQLTERNIDSRITNRGQQENTNSSFNQKNQYNLPNSARQSRQKQRTPLKISQDIQSSFIKNQFLKSSTPIDFTQKNASQILESLNNIYPKPFKEFNPSQKPLQIKQEFKNNIEMPIKDPYFINQLDQSFEKEQKNLYKPKQNMTQYMNRYTQRQKLLNTEETRISQNKSLNSENIIDFSKSYLTKIKKKSQSKDNSLYQQQLYLI